MSKAAVATAARTPAAADGPVWSQVWQLPVLIIGAGLFAAGIWLAIPEKQPNDFPRRLDEVAYYIEANNLDGAELALESVQRLMEKAVDATNEDKARQWQYWADLNFLQLQQRTHVAVDTELSRETNRKIVGWYAQAEGMGRKIDGKSTRRYAETLVALGRDADALALVDRMTGEPPYRRYEIIRALIDKQRARREGNDLTAITPLLERFKHELRGEENAPRRREQEIWCTALEAKLQLDVDDSERAIDFLLMKVQRFTSAGGDADLGELQVLLAQAYQSIGDLENASRLYRYAQQRLTSESDLNAEVLLGLGQIALATSEDQNVQTALEHFTLAVKSYPNAPTYTEALIGRADCEARLGSYPEAIEHFGEAVRKLSEHSANWDKRRQTMTEVVRSHIDRSLDQEEFDLALDFLTLLVPLHEPELPAELLLDFAVIHENLADERKNYADQLTQRKNAGEADVSDDARRLVNQESAHHYQEAGAYFLRHARAVTILDDSEHGASLWKAAQSFDRAQDWRGAIEVYGEFVKTRQNDARRLAAVHQLGKAYLADGQYGPAAELFLGLIDDHPNSPEAFDSLVPLARSYIGTGQSDAAERVLLQVVTDHPAITPDSTQYQQALVELGKLYYRLGESKPDYFVPAIERLEEAVQRYGTSAESPTLRYLLADSYRKSVGALDQRLQERQSQSERLALQAERSRRLEQAQVFYNQVVSELEAKPAGTLNGLEQLYRRNSYFYQADAAFDRGQYETAIQLYDNAARRWDKDPASLVALVQIVNAYCELGQYQQAKVANETARWQLERIPESAFEDQTLPMSRQHWEDWLRWTSELELFATDATAKPALNPQR